MQNQELKLIRKTLRIKRKELSVDFQQRAASVITTKIIHSEIFQQSKTVALYLPTENEVATDAIMRAIWQNNKLCYLPRIKSSTEKTLEFIRYDKNDELRTCKYGITEPIYNEQKIIDPANLDLVIVPLVGFNDNFFRLGRGAGFYDRTFSYKLAHPEQKPFLLGIAYEFQRIEFKQNSWDVPMQLVITEKS